MSILRNKIKPITIFILLFLLMAVLSNTGMKCQAKEENPYGEGNWTLNRASMSIIHKNGTKLQQKHDDFRLSKISSEILKENKSWAQIEITIGESNRNTDYWKDEGDLNHSKNFIIRVRKSNNMAYIGPDKHVIGFNPFYVYKYTNTKITNEGNGEITINTDKEYQIFYCNEGYSINHTLGIESKKKIEFQRSISDGSLSLPMIDVNAKGHYPVSYHIFLPAEYVLNNCTTEEYVWLKAAYEDDNEEVRDFLESVDNGGEPEYMNRFPTRLVAITAIIMVPSVIFGYMTYKKRR